jgi:hypothetical protein
MECVPCVSVEVAQVAAPLESATDVQIAVDPSRNVTLPVGVPALPETDAVKVTPWPTVEGFAEEASETVAVASVPFTVCVTVFELAAAYIASPE